MEMNYTDYIVYVNKLLLDGSVRKAVDKLEPLGKFEMRGIGQWEPIYYPGFTLITPVCGEDRDNADTYKKLLTVRKQRLSGNINLSKCVEAPDQALHMTVARLVSGTVYEANRIEQHTDSFLARMQGLFEKLAISGQLRFEIKGVCVLPQGVIAASVAPKNEADYNCLQNLRDFLYSDKTLQAFGVERKREFVGHISLFYVEKELDNMEKQILHDTIIHINRQFFAEPLPFRIRKAEVRKFNNFLHFDREENWPVFEFI